MANNLSSFFATGSQYYPGLKKQTLPNGGGTFTPTGKSTIEPAPIFTGVKKTAPQRNFYKDGGSYFYADNNQKILDPNELGVASQSGVEVDSPAGAGTQSSFYDKYKDPKTGKVMTPEEWGVYVGNKIPKGNGEITNYAGDAKANPDQTARELKDKAIDLNNSRNDIATGTTDPYNIASQSGIPYSGAELAAIEKAYAGVYDPALKDVFARLEATQAEEKQKSDIEAAKEMEVFKTNEAIRQWRATTGTQKTGDGNTVKDLFSDTQLNQAARTAGVGLEAIRDMDPDLINFFYAPPSDTDPDSGKKYPMDVVFENIVTQVANGEMTEDEAENQMNEMNVTPPVKQYYIEKIPAAPEKKEKWIKKAWDRVINSVMK